MKFYLETASGRFIKELDGFIIKDESYQYQAKPGGPLYTRSAFTVEVNTLEELLDLVDKNLGGVVVEWQAQYPPAAPIQHIPILRIVDDVL
jgi:hypothetical protein